MHDEPLGIETRERARVRGDVTGPSLPESEERFRLTFEEAPTGMALVGLDGSFLRVNRSFSQIVGYEAEELLELTFAQITHPEDVEIDLGLAEALLRGDIERYELGKRYIRKDGSEVDVRLHGSIVRRSDGTPVHFIAQVEDVSERVRMERALRESESRFRLLAENARDVIFRYCVRPPSFEYISPAIERFTGYRPEEFYADPGIVARLLHPEDRSHLAELLVKSGSPEPVLVRWLRRDGGIRWAEHHFRTEFDSSGGLVAVEGIARDVTVRRETEEALEVLRRQHELILSSTGEGIYGLDEEGRTIFVNPAAATTVGWTPQDLIGLRQHDVLHHSHPDGSPYRVEDCPIYAAIRDGRSHRVDDEVFWRKDGSSFPVRYTSTPMRNEQGEVVGAVVSFSDITEEREAQFRLQRLMDEVAAERSWLQTLIDRSPAGIVLLDRDGVLSANERARALLGSDVTSTRDATPRVHHPDRQAIAPEDAPIQRAMRGESIIGREYVIRRGLRDWVPVLVSAAPIAGPHGERLGAVAVFEDLSTVKELEQRREEWVSLIAHDLRQPLTVILANAERLASQSAEEAIHRRAENIRISARRLHRMTLDLLDASRIEAHRLSLERSSVNLAGLIRGALDRLVPEEQASRVQLELQEGVPPVMVDAGRIEQVLANLLSNALKYGTPGTPIGVRLSLRDGQAAEVCVANEGPDIPPEEQGSLFSRFHRTKEARRGGQPGLGLGLYIAHGLVAAHGGFMWVESGNGQTVFRFALPLAVSGN